MNWKLEYKSFHILWGGFVAVYFMPMGWEPFDRSLLAGFALLQWYAQEHVILCLIPAFFIAGAISVYVSQTLVIRYFGADSPKWLAYLIASGSGSILAVCSCTILPLFSGIHKRGAGLGPAIAFLYSGPAINILAIVLTARILGMELGVARALGAIGFSVVIGLIMSWLFREEEGNRGALALPDEDSNHSLGQIVLHLSLLMGILIFANWAKPDQAEGIWWNLYQWKWELTALLGGGLAYNLVFLLKLPWWRVAASVATVLVAYFLAPHQPLIPFITAVLALSLLLGSGPDSGKNWLNSSWDFSKQIIPLLGMGVLVAGFLLGQPGGTGGLVPTAWIANSVGGNSWGANLFASVAGAFMYFATLTEIPILQGLLQNGMGKGPALALLLAGPALSLPSMLVINEVIGPKKTIAYVSLVIIMATLSGYLYGSLFG